MPAISPSSVALPCYLPISLCQAALQSNVHMAGDLSFAWTIRSYAHPQQPSTASPGKFGYVGVARLLILEQQLFKHLIHGPLPHPCMDQQSQILSQAQSLSHGIPMQMGCPLLLCIPSSCQIAMHTHPIGYVKHRMLAGAQLVCV